MSILHICARQLDRYSFRVWDTVTQQRYDQTGIDLTTVTAAKIVFKDLKTNTEYEIDILDDWYYLLGDGLDINIIQFPNMKMGDYDYFPDWMYDIKVVYTYSGTEYSSTKIIGFRTIITGIINQQLQQAEWIKELRCGCGCKKYATSFRKYDFLHLLEIASLNCLKSQYTDLLLSLYKLSGTTHEYA